MMKFTKTKLSLALIATSVISASSAFAADSDLASALTDGKLSANFNLRYEAVEQDNAAKDADAFTLRTRLNYTTGIFNGFSAAVEVENSIALVDDYKDAIGNGNEFSVVADPDHTELDQAYIAYKEGKLSGKVLPVVVDTPLGRLDSKHRNKLVKHYFPEAGEQVILLSTDTEVDEDFFSAMAHEISHAFEIEFNEQTKCSTLNEGYFWKDTSVVAQKEAV